MSVRDDITKDVLAKFHVPLSLNVVEKLLDWQGRQKVAYEAMKGLAHKDFHGLSDFREQIEMYSKSNIILTIAIRLIRPILLKNRMLLLTMFRNKVLGLVGKFLQNLHGFDRVFTLAPQVLTNINSLKANLPTKK